MQIGHTIAVSFIRPSFWLAALRDFAGKLPRDLTVADTARKRRPAYNPPEEEFVETMRSIALEALKETASMPLAFTDTEVTIFYRPSQHRSQCKAVTRSW